MSVDIHVLEAARMDDFLARRRATMGFPAEVNLAENLAAILHKSNEFVPSQAGCILLDNPLDKLPDKTRNQLTFVAAFGDKSRELIGRGIPASTGIAGQVYTSGAPYHSDDVRADSFFNDGVDRDTTYRTESIVAIPIQIEQEVCGVLELINRQGAVAYSDQDRNLLHIFAGYISISIQNILDGRRAQELAKRDNLTGLYNDHYLHVAMANRIESALTREHDLAVLFIDLDQFKRVNDTHGHLIGSQVLREVGHMLKTQVRRDDAIAARYGGDEFVLVVPTMDLETGYTLAETIRHRIEQLPFRLRHDAAPTPLGEIGVSCSIGIATLRQHLAASVNTVETAKSAMLRLADAAMYAAK
ncbi:MAG: sensor domain-containing diguanylate cyclase, partial [Acidobacteriota bacterium]